MKKVSYLNGIPIIDDDTPADFLFHEHFGRGHDPEQYNPEMLAAPSGMKLIETSEYDDRIAEQTKEESSLEHIYLRENFENLDQNGHGYCWAYSTVHCVMLLRAKMGQPLIRLNPHAIAAIIKGGRDEGGWCGLSTKFLREYGVPTEEFWPVHARNLKYDTPEMRANAALHKITEDWYDLARPVHGQVLTLRQVDTNLLLNNPCALDFNWWGHSVCGVRLVKVENGSYGRMILNSWKGWGRRGLAILQGSKAIPNGAVSLRNTVASVT